MKKKGQVLRNCLLKAVPADANFEFAFLTDIGAKDIKVTGVDFSYAVVERSYFKKLCLTGVNL